MVLSYIPCDITNFSNLFENYKNLRKLNVKEVNELFWDLLDTSFCRFVITKGKYKGKLCMKPIKEQFINEEYCYCSVHRYQEMECKVIDCNNKRRKSSCFCTKHYNRLYNININHNFNENDIIRSFYDIELFIEKIEDPKMDNFYYINKNIYNIKISDNSVLPKSFYNHSSLYETYNNQPIIKYKRFSIMNFLYNMYNKFIKQINHFIKKYKININFLYYLLFLIKQINENYYPMDVILYKNKFVFNKNIYDYINNEKIKKLYEYIYKIYNTNYINIFKVLNVTDNNHKVNDDYYNYVKDMVKIEYNILNKYYHTCLNIFDIKVKDINIVRRSTPKLICYNILKLKSVERKEKKRLQKFNIKYNKLIKINKEIFMWADKTLKTTIYKDNVYNIINEHMNHLDEIIEIHGKDINFIRNTYRTIYSYLCDGWEFYPRYDNDEKHDFNIVYNSDTWRLYGSHEDEEFKKLFKI